MGKKNRVRKSGADRTKRQKSWGKMDIYRKFGGNKFQNLRIKMTGQPAHNNIFKMEKSYIE